MGIKSAWEALRGIAAPRSAKGLDSFDGGGYRDYGPNYGTLFRDKDESKTPWVNSAWYACAAWTCNAFSEAECVLQRRDPADPNKWITDPLHPLSQMLKRPNAFYGPSKLWAGTTISKMSSGNGYWVKARNPVTGVVEGLWYYPAEYIRPDWDRHNGGPWISRYLVSQNAFGLVEGIPDGTRELDVRDVVHFRNLLDPDNARVGLNPMVANGFELKTDQEAARATFTMMRNLGVAVPMFAPEGGVTIDSDTAELFKTQYAMGTTGTNRGKPVVAAKSLKYMNVGGTPKDMEFSSNRMDATARVCATYNLDPMVLGLPSLSKTFANYKEAREAATEGAIVPSYRTISEELDIQLLPDFVPDPENYRVKFLFEDIRALQQDMSAARLDAAKLYAAQAIDRWQAKTIAGVTPEEADKGVYATARAAGTDPNAPDAIEKAAKALWEAHSHIRSGR